MKNEEFIILILRKMYKPSKIKRKTLFLLHLARFASLDFAALYL